MSEDELRRDRRACVWITALYLSVSLPLAVLLPGADDEGYLTFIGAAALARAPLACVFFQKFHPTLSLVYALPTMLGWRWFRLLHALVAGTAVFFVGDATGRLGGRGWMASALLALSPVFVLSAASGQSNTDGVALFALTLALASREGIATRAACVVASVAPWARYEFSVPLAVIVLALVLAPGIARRERFVRLACAAALPVGYLALGALYHRDALWFLHYPPSITTPVAGNPVYHFLEPTFASMSTLVGQMTLATVGWPFLALLRFRPLPYLGRALVVGLLLVLVLLVVLPLFHMFFEGLGVRYMLAYAPIVAPLVGLADASSSIAYRRLVALAIVLDLLVVPFVSGETWSRLGARTRRADEALARQLEGRAGTGIVYTDDKELALLLSGTSVQTRFIPTHDILTEVHRLTNHDNGQYDAVMHALDDTLYGSAAWPCALGPFGPDDVIVLAGDRRLAVLFPPEYWERSTILVEEWHDVQIRRPREPGSRLPPPMIAPGIDPVPVLEACDHLEASP